MLSPSELLETLELYFIVPTKSKNLLCKVDNGITTEKNHDYFLVIHIF